MTKPLIPASIASISLILALASFHCPELRAEPPEELAEQVVQKIFRRACFECHDARQEKSDLRLDTREAALATPGVIEPGNAAKSELVRRILLPEGHDEVMPNRGKTLSPAEIQSIRDWIDAGAAWPAETVSAKHWAYVQPTRPAVPSVTLAGEPVPHPIDAFVLERLQQSGLTFSPPAERAQLIRRLSLDLIGLPPSPAEVLAYEQDDDPRATELLIDRLLSSKQFGVRWARPWLDYARYADSHGFQRDDFRDLWPYRDWVVDALNEDMPFTQFTIEQLAGDLLAEATEAQKIATGFNRSAPTNVEAGTDPEETRVNQVLDRVNTLGMIWLGTTLECAQCHDHKYDPISQRNYYGLFAFFNNTALEADRTNPKAPGSIQFRGPEMSLSDPETQAEREQLEAQLSHARDALTELEDRLAPQQSAWELSLAAQRSQSAQEHVLDITKFESAGGATHEILADKSVLLSGEPVPDEDTYTVTLQTKLSGIRGIKLEALTDDSLPGQGPGRGDAKRPNFVLNNVEVFVAPAGDNTRGKLVQFDDARASFSQTKFPVKNLLSSNNSARSGWAINPRFGQSHWAILESAQPLGYEKGTVLTIRLEQNFGASRTIGRLRISALTGELGTEAVPADLAAAIKTPVDKRTAAQKKVIASNWRKHQPELAALETKKSKLEAELKKLKAPTTLVMLEETPRTTFLFDRGDFRSPKAEVAPHVPEVLHPMSREHSSQPTRLDLAQWLVSGENPLVARVTVNRWWAELFGHGLVVTPEDFGLKGEPPTHPALLDWLACEFMENGWSMKQLLRTIVTSRTYQQSSNVSRELRERDDRNLLYARGPRVRLEAELIRDNALAIAGLLDLKQGGPPIKPYQPDGVWLKVGGQRYEYEVSPGSERHRRGLYVVWKRGAPYPSFVNFDANSRMACRVKRPHSNTPLQALTLLNDPVYVEAAIAFARRVLTECPTDSTDDSLEERLRYAVRLATARSAKPTELATLTDLYRAELEARERNPAAAEKFAKNLELPHGVNEAEFAAWYAVTAALINLDETITKN